MAAKEAFSNEDMADIFKQDANPFGSSDNFSDEDMADIFSGSAPSFTGVAATQTAVTDAAKDAIVEAALPEILGSKKIGAVMVGMGHGMTFLWRGGKQLLGIDEESMKADEALMDDLFGSKKYGGYALGGEITGAIADPAALLIPGTMVAKAGTVLTKSQMAIRASVAAAKGIAVGATYAGLGYVREDKGETRTGNMVMGGTIGGVLAGGSNLVRDVVSNASITKAITTTTNVEKSFAQKILDGKDAKTAMAELKAEMPKLDKDLKHAVDTLGRKPKLTLNPKEAALVVDHYNGLHTVSRQEPGGIIDNFAGIMSTRLKNQSEALHGRLMLHDSNKAVRTQELMERVDPFLKSYDSKFSTLSKAMNPELQDVQNGIKQALLNSDVTTAKNLLTKHVGKDAVKQLDEVYKVTKEVGSELVSNGILKQSDLVDNYFPRFMVRKDDFFKSIGKEATDKVQDMLAAANKKMLAEAGRSLTELEQGMIIDKAMRGFPKLGFSPSFTKGRKITNVPLKYLEFYADPAEALHSHINESISTIEKWKFFGRDNIAVVKAGGTPILNTEKSVGMLMQKELAGQKLDAGSLKEIELLLNARFGIGERSPTGSIQDIRNIMYATTMANPLSAAVQLGDIGPTLYINGLKPTVKSAFKILTGKAEVTAKEFGFVDRMSEEFVSTRKTAKWLNSSFKWAGFAKVDQFSKTTNLQAGLEKFRGFANKSPEKLRSQFGAMLGDDIEKAILDLKAGKITNDIKAMLWSDLARWQPISKSEMPVAWLNHPDGRIGYMYKSFMLKQLDVIRNDVVNEFKKGNRGQALKNMTSLGLLLGASGAGAEKVQEFLSGRDINDIIADTTWNDIPKNMLKTFGLGQLVLQDLERGQPIKAAFDAIVPAWESYDQLFPATFSEDGIEIKEDYGAKVLKNTPVVGKEAYMWFGGGLEKLEERKADER